MDKIAQYLGKDRTDVRAANFIQPDEFPYDQQMIFQDGRPLIYDSGDYPESLRKLKDLIGWDEFPLMQSKAAEEGRRLGIGVGCYVEGTGVGPYEGGHVQVTSDGRVHVSTGLTSQGQGHETVFAQIAATELGVPIEKVSVVTGDTRRFGYAVGTFASRAAVMSGNAIALACRKVKEKALRIAADALEADPADLEITDGMVHVVRRAQRLDPARHRRRACPTRCATPSTRRPSAPPSSPPAAAWTSRPVAEGEEPGLEGKDYYSPVRSTFASGMHAAIVETDPDTAEIKILRYAVVHDCGKMINPMLVEGQIHGGVAQGVGGALYEKMVYDEHGQLLNASFMDFLMPYVTEIPGNRDRPFGDPVPAQSPGHQRGGRGRGHPGLRRHRRRGGGRREDRHRPDADLPVGPLRVARLQQDLRSGQPLAEHPVGPRLVGDDPPGARAGRST